MVEYPLLFFVTGDDVRLNNRYDHAGAPSQASAARGARAARESRVTVYRGRISLWDNLKFMAIVLVVVGHFADYLTESSMISRSIRLFIYAFHMPLFFFISGLFHRDREVTRRCTFLVLSGFLLKMVFASLPLLRGREPSFELTGGGGIPWFLFVLAAFTALTYILREQNLKLILFCSFILGMAVGYDRSVGDAFYLSRTLVFYPFYLMGRTLAQPGATELRKKNRWITIFALVFLFAWGYLCYRFPDQLSFLQDLFSGKMPYAEIFEGYDRINVLCGPIYRAGFYLLGFLLIWSFIFITPYYRIKALTYLGSHTINVYFWHGIIMKVVNRYLPYKQMVDTGLPEWVIILAIPLALSVILSLGIFDFPLHYLKQAVYKKE
jgi:fucose 4-O-acetylase-like acetyltransferase